MSWDRGQLHIIDPAQKTLDFLPDDESKAGFQNDPFL
jgi:hypothetical protein